MTGSKRQEDRLNKCAYITCRNPPLFLLADKPSIKQHTEEKLWDSWRNQNKNEESKGDLSVGMIFTGSGKHFKV